MATATNRISNGKVVNSRHMKMDEYKGSPMIVFQADEDDRFPFQFQKGKAAKILAAIDDVGAEAVIGALRRLVNG